MLNLKKKACVSSVESAELLIHIHCKKQKHQPLGMSPCSVEPLSYGLLVNMKHSLRQQAIHSIFAEHLTLHPIQKMGTLIWLVVSTPLKKYELVNEKDDIPYMKWKIKNLPNHQSDILLLTIDVP